MKKIKRMANLIRKQFMSVDEPLRLHFITNLAEGLLFLFLTLLLSILERNGWFLALGMATCVVVFGKTYYLVLSCVDGLCQRYDGECIVVRTIPHPLEPKLVLRMDDGSFIEIMGAIKKRRINEGNIVALYLPYKALHQVSDDTYRCNNVYYTHVIRKNYKTAYQNNNYKKQRGWRNFFTRS